MAKNSNKVQKNTQKENNIKRLAENRYAKFRKMGKYLESQTIENEISV